MRRRQYAAGAAGTRVVVNKLVAGKARIDMFTANGGISDRPFDEASVLTPGMALRLDWKVTNAVTLCVERISARGPALMVTDPVRTFADLGIVTHSKPSLFRYRLTAKGACGAPVIGEITVVASQRPMLRAAGIAVGQGWADPKIRLVAGKPTVVQVRVRHGLNGWGDNAVPAVTGQLWLRSPWTGITDIVNPATIPGGPGTPMTETVGASITVRSYPRWTVLNHILNFLIPGQLAVPADRTASVRISVSGFGAIGGFAGFSQSLVKAVPMPTFHPRRRLDIRYLPIRWGGIAAPSDAECVEAIQQALTFLPTPGANVTPLWPGQIGTYAATEVNFSDPFGDILDDFQEMHHGDALWVLIVRDPVGNVAGDAGTVPSNVMITSLRTDAAKTAAHELGHCLGQKHIELCGALGGDPAAAWDGGNHTGVVVDWRRGLAIGNPWDLMTYCDFGWPVPRRWTQLFDRVGP